MVCNLCKDPHGIPMEKGHRVRVNNSNGLPYKAIVKRYNKINDEYFFKGYPKPAKACDVSHLPGGSENRDDRANRRTKKFLNQTMEVYSFYIVPNMTLEESRFNYRYHPSRWMTPG
jgi:hypothetical protein